MNATLVVMAAGLGSRYGGEKQIDGLGPNGEILMEYSVYDAVQAGFHKIVFIIKPHMLETMQTLCAKKINSLKTPEGAAVEVCFVFQDFTSIPPFYSVPGDREKPFGTVHAALCASEVVDEPFALINADDFYGRTAYETIFEALKNLKPEGEAVMVGYLLKNAVSDNGTVTRGVCIQEGGKLKKLKETYKIKKYPNGQIFNCEDPENELELDINTLVSMNFWGFTPWIFKELTRYFDAFLKALPKTERKAECLLPELVDELIRTGKMEVPVLSTDSTWFGVTYREDKAIVQNELKKLHESGNYPVSLR
ncbi:MAG: sugar phosphate nucleotidyltransferase [Evtepia sp.]